MHEYNSQLEHLHLKEYGRNIQKIAQYVNALDDEDKKSRLARALVELMKQINPNSKENLDYDHMVWDHLYFVSDLQLDVKDSPYPKPITKVQPAPKRVAYTTGNIRFLHYGRNVENMIKKAIELEDAEEKETATIHIARLMKRFYNTWNKENVESEVILNHIEILSNKKLSLSLDKVNDENLLNLPKVQNTQGNNSSYPAPRASSNSHRRSGGNNGNSSSSNGNNNSQQNRRRRK